MAPVTLKTIDGKHPSPQLQAHPTNHLPRRPQRCHSAPLRDAKRCPRLPRTRDTTRAYAQTVRHLNWRLESHSKAAHISPNILLRGTQNTRDNQHRTTARPDKANTRSESQKEPHSRPLNTFNTYRTPKIPRTPTRIRPLQPSARQHSAPPRDHRLRRLRPQPRHLHP